MRHKLVSVLLLLIAALFSGFCEGQLESESSQPEGAWGLPFKTMDAVINWENEKLYFFQC